MEQHVISNFLKSLNPSVSRGCCLSNASSTLKESCKGTSSSQHIVVLHNECEQKMTRDVFWISNGDFWLNL